MKSLKAIAIVAAYMLGVVAVFSIGYNIGWIVGVTDSEFFDKAVELQQATKELLERAERVVCRYTA